MAAVPVTGVVEFTVAGVLALPQPLVSVNAARINTFSSAGMRLLLFGRKVSSSKPSDASTGCHGKFELLRNGMEFANVAAAVSVSVELAVPFSVTEDGLMLHVTSGELVAQVRLTIVLRLPTSARLRPTVVEAPSATVTCEVATESVKFPV